jgi:ribonuclease P/MRP protein subunit RPP1
MFYDLHVRAEAGKAAEMAGRLGLSGIGLAVQSGVHAKSQEVEALREMAGSAKVDIAIGIEIQGRPNQIPHLAKNARMQYELILVRGGTEETNRAALETPEVDILVGSNLESGTCGINHILARLGAKNNVAVCFDLLEIIKAYKKARANLLTSYIETARFVRKYRCPFVLSAGALGEWDMRGASELIAFGKFLGFQENQCRRALSGEILRENRKRLSGKWVMPGVEVE